MKQLETSLLVLLLLVLNCIAGYRWTIINKKYSSKPDLAVCNTSECIAAADQLIKSMDLSVDPCEDFFQFACGGWIEKHPIPDTKSTWTQFDVLTEEVDLLLNSGIYSFFFEIIFSWTFLFKDILQEDLNVEDAVPINSARNMYRACMDAERRESVGLTPLTDLLATFGGWPMTQRQWNEEDFNWKDVSATVRKFYGVTLLINVYNSLDSEDTEHSSIYVDHGSLALPRSVLVEPQENGMILAGYVELISGSARAVRDHLQSGVSDEEISRQVKDLVKFEIDLAGITTREEDRRNNSRMYNPFNLLELQEWTDFVGVKSSQAQIGWFKYVRDVYSFANVSVSYEERVIVVETEYLKKLVALLESTEPRTLANYIHWRIVDELGSETTQQMIDLAFEFDRLIYGTSRPEPRWKDCTGKINNLVGFAVGAKYVEKSFDDDAKTEVMRMISNLKAAFKKLVDESSWMDADTKIIAGEKVDAMREFVAYPDWIRNTTALENYYHGLEVDAGDHFRNIRNAAAFSSVEEFKTLRNKTDRTKWLIHPSIVDAFYQTEYNSITFPAGILQRPYFAKGRIEATNYGGIGGVIGHEITHGFDDQGRQSDKDGNTVQWWTEETLQNYLTRAQCFIDEYSNRTIASGTHLNGVNAQGENIADNGGIREAFLAYGYYVAVNGEEARLPGLEQYTAEQIFFISYANVWCGSDTKEGLENQIVTDPHSPSYFRANIPISNSEDFHRHFNCPVGSAMNPAARCVLW